MGALRAGGGRGEVRFRSARIRRRRGTLRRRYMTGVHVALSSSVVCRLSSSSSSVIVAVVVRFVGREKKKIRRRVFFFLSLSSSPPTRIHVGVVSPPRLAYKDRDFFPLFPSSAYRRPAACLRGGALGSTPPPRGPYHESSGLQITAVGRNVKITKKTPVGLGRYGVFSHRDVVADRQKAKPTGVTVCKRIYFNFRPSPLHSDEKSLSTPPQSLSRDFPRRRRPPLLRSHRLFRTTAETARGPKLWSNLVDR